MNSFVGPAVINTVLFRNSLLLSNRTLLIIVSVEGNFPFPTSPHANNPDAGSIRLNPNLESFLIFSCIIGFSYIAVFIAGKIKTLLKFLTANIKDEAKSSARPFANFEIKLAVAGATIILSAHFPKSICCISSSLSSVNVSV